MTQRAASIDRDGVLDEDHGHVFRSEDVHCLPGAIAALARLQQAGCALMVTKPSGIARGFHSEADLARRNAHMQAELQAQGAAPAAAHACPHHPESSVVAYRRNCDCRKPAPGRILPEAVDSLLGATA